MRQKTILLPLIIVVSISCAICAITIVHKKQSTHNAIKAVNCLYSFDNYEEIYNDNMTELALLVSDNVLKDLNYKDLNRALTAYLKFRGNPSKVIVLDATDSHIIYKIDCDSITPDRIFMFSYETNILGKITSVKEYELHAFYKSDSTNATSK